MPAVLAGCSLIYNPNNLPDPPVEAGIEGPIPIDASIDASAVQDANDSLLSLSDIAPTTIDEGQGDGGSLPAVFVIRGHNIVNSNLKVELIPPDDVAVKLIPVTDALASHDGDYLAFTLTAQVDTALSSDVSLNIKVTQDVSPQYGGGTATQMLPAALTLHGLPELTRVDLGSGNTLTTPATATATVQRYSKVDLSAVATVNVTGSSPLVVSAAASIHLAGIVSFATAAVPGAGGNAGGLNAGACATVGGGGGRGGDADLGQLIKSGGGGGGGGASVAATAGTAGSGGFAGLAGLKSGDDTMVSLAANAACAGGGGGKGGLLGSTGTPGSGGGGGGTLALLAGGDLTSAAISVKGGNGVAGFGGGGGGGGGAGGNVLLRTDNGTLTTGAIDISAGSGGSSGGAGAVGRTRWDAPDGAAPSGQARRGIAFGRMPSRVFTTSSPTFPVVGTSGDGFSFRVIDQSGASHDGGHASFNNDAATISPVLHAGANRVCVTIDGGARGSFEADRCVDVVFLP